MNQQVLASVRDFHEPDPRLEHRLAAEADEARGDDFRGGRVDAKTELHEWLQALRLPVPATLERAGRAFVNRALDVSLARTRLGFVPITLDVGLRTLR